MKVPAGEFKELKIYAVLVREYGSLAGVCAERRQREVRYEYGKAKKG